VGVRALVAQLCCLGLLRAMRRRRPAALPQHGEGDGRAPRAAEDGARRPATALAVRPGPSPLAVAVTGNLAALATELRETGELTQLLARAAAGHRLDDVQRAKVRAQLIDVAKAVPALALLAAPGGLLILPVLAKVLPFSLLPSAWDRPRLPPPAPRADGSAAPACAAAPAERVAVEPPAA
jgi:hypothetical protein